MQTLYFAILLIPYRTMRDHFLDYPLGGNVLTILVASIIVSALVQGKRLPRTSLYVTWLVFGAYLYFSMWIGTMLGNASAPLWLNDLNFVTWKDYMLIPLIFVAAGLVIEDRKAVRTVVLITAISLLAIDRSALMNSLSRSWATFDEDKRDGGPLGYAGANGLAALLAQLSIFYWGFLQFVKQKKFRLLGYALVALTLLATMYTFSRASYLAVVTGVLLLGILKDRKLILVSVAFLLTWQAIVPKAVTQRVNMTQNANGQLEQSAEERVRLWEDAKSTFFHSPIFGTGYASYQMTRHTDNLRDTHNWYVKVLVETGIIGGIIALVLLLQMLSLSIRLFRHAKDPLYRGLGLGSLLMTVCSIILNFFGDRWTYVEISGMVWVLYAAAARAALLREPVAVEAPSLEPGAADVNPYLVLR
ncbi:O-antigen ligase family protein [Edaphobacter bradus]|uniref:O-antigen ligase family protein n=1 Tax=Edaphobacter bradus TaxID=2259016 RepID=UPI0021DF5797|nr:O-antigen ligase family protein [Edaphobacter bradus]